MVNKIKLDISEIYEECRLIRNKRLKHDMIQYRILKLAEKYNCIGLKEYHCSYRGYNNKKYINGRIDVVWRDNNKKVIVAFEIDSSIRSKSIIKLLNVNSIYKIWLCYGEDKQKISNYKCELDKNRVIEYVLPEQ